MAIKHNNVIPDVHFRKWWQRYVKTWFNQPARKQRRREARKAKAARVFPRPVGLLRPAVHCSSQRFNMRIREGRGFSLAELKAAGIPAMKARTIGIAVDKRRVNKSQESLDLNIDRLKQYMAKLKVFPLKSKAKNGDTARSELKNVAQNTCKTIIPLPKAGSSFQGLETITEAMREGSVYTTLREANNRRTILARKKKAAAAAAE